MEYMIISDIFESEEFYPHLNSLERITVLDSSIIRKRPAADIDFNGTKEELLRYLQYESNQVRIYNVKNIPLPQNPRQTLK